MTAAAIAIVNLLWALGSEPVIPRATQPDITSQSKVRQAMCLAMAGLLWRWQQLILPFLVALAVADE